MLRPFGLIFNTIGGISEIVILLVGLRRRATHVVYTLYERTVVFS